MAYYYTTHTRNAACRMWSYDYVKYRARPLEYYIPQCIVPNLTFHFIKCKLRMNHYLISPLKVKKNKIKIKNAHKFVLQCRKKNWFIFSLINYFFTDVIMHMWKNYVQYCTSINILQFKGTVHLKMLMYSTCCFGVSIVHTSTFIFFCISE